MSKKNKKQDEFIQRQQSDYTKPEYLLSQKDRPFNLS